jgi:hypothetical protein
VAQQEPAIRAAWQSDASAVICLNELDVGHFTIVLPRQGTDDFLDPTGSGVIGKRKNVLLKNGWVRLGGC